ncbi:NADP-dependent oxidoreductase [Microlunatus endophyticus]|uniref:NADP-dependent oxidoreductase n=1 Tax=Microlunatus endophyticus TaxID=1716077 RepID=A0A917SCN7_9ACTN|nr:aldo/keto reductase [Microlunatus endophyticus]GGL72689.1 NADP-dependent oxidoreductase [Microlunatus endophyticus]
MTWTASTHQERRKQFGRFLLGTGGIGGIAAATGPGLGLSEEDGLKLIDRAVGEGFKILDTADVYTGGTSERVVGTWNREHAGTEVLTQTKTGITPSGPDLSPERVQRQLDHSIAVLGHVDLFVAHQIDTTTPMQDWLPVFSTAVENGSVRAYGLSNVSAAQLTEALETADRLGLARPEIIQNSYSLLVRGDDKDVLPIAVSEGLAYEAYSPLATGVLAGRYSNGERPAAGSRASVASRADTYLDDPDLMERVRAFDQLAAETGVSSAGLALAWLVNHPTVTAPIVGPSKDSQWQGIREATQVKWTADLADRLDALFPVQ